MSFSLLIDDGYHEIRQVLTDLLKVTELSGWRRLKVMFSIGQISRVLGFTRQAVRFYEEKGIIKPIKDINGWRYYDEDSISRLISARKYLAMGYKISEVVKQFSNSTPETIAETLDSKYAETNEKINQLKVVAETIDEYRNKIRKLSELMGSFIIRKSPPQAIFYSQPNNQLEEELIPDTKIWVDALPVSRITAFYDGQQLKSKQKMDRKHKGFSIDQGLAEKYGLIKLKSTRFIPERLSANTVLSVKSDTIACLNIADEAHAFFINTGLQIDGDPWGQIIFSESNKSNPNDVKPYKQYIDLWLPVKQVQ